MHPFILNVKKTIAKYEMLQPGERVVVAVSGGADSMALLLVLWEIKRDLSLSLVVAHLDHGLRPEAKEEKMFVRKAAADLGVPFVSRKVDVREWQKGQRLALQEAAREARYAFFLDAAREQKATKIALGHTADDQAESMVMRILRGSGTRGLSGIPPIRGGMMIRPLIESWRAEVESFLKDRRISFRSDPSNRSLHFLRSRIRHELLPILQQYNPRVRQTLVQMADLFRAEEGFWQKLVEEKFPAVARHHKRDSLALDIPALMEQPFPLRLRILRYAIEKLRGHLRRINLSHMLAVESLLQSPEPNKNLHLPQGLVVEKTYHVLSFSKSKEEAIPFEHSLFGPGYLEIPEIGRGIRLEVQQRRPKEPFEESSCIALLDFDTLDFPLIVRSFRPGDRLQPLGMEEGEKKVKDLFIDCKIPLQQRKRIPLLFKEDRVLWVAGVRLDHRARLKPETRRVLKVEFI